MNVHAIRRIVHEVGRQEVRMRFGNGGAKQHAAADPPVLMSTLTDSGGSLSREGAEGSRFNPLARMLVKAAVGIGECEWEKHGTEVSRVRHRSLGEGVPHDIVDSPKLELRGLDSTDEEPYWFAQQLGGMFVRVYVTCSTMLWCPSAPTILLDFRLSWTTVRNFPRPHPLSSCLSHPVVCPDVVKLDDRGLEDLHATTQRERAGTCPCATTQVPMVSALRHRLTGIIQRKCLAAGMHGSEDAPVAKMGPDSLRLATVRALLAPSEGTPSISEKKSHMKAHNEDARDMEKERVAT